ncbi:MULTISPECIES: beta-N-acetylhexosaminidase [Halomonadaceae]|uniref:Beta-hexosaminidase n=2 Tax=Halomonadaceae TaxID=28256 RepID=A0A8H9I7C3_9GAMM|nr:MULTISPECIES: beta-N-acetylhexosaminidase [Halomonas]ATH78710.1 beta-N-acetylhexosaminidase [Halomonas hydrothermalis]KHJ50128.1 beta-hexosaminidase [Halomonas hydrothermalis]UDM05686.1 beta-N-acetylhexosaminidase [Halomonas sp. NyZ770]GGW36793.1 beta-hexosaminidase [Halomonas hamiltonii]GGW65950.1 beta-hexosaminidase [Halomonas johnsoniae]
MTQPLGPVMLDLEGQTLTKEDKRLLKNPAVGGVILFARNVESATQVRELCDSIRRVRGDLLLAVDQEGGRVQRIRQGVTRLPPMARIGDVFAHDQSVGLALAKDTGWLLGMEMAACGLDISFAPVLDVDSGISSVIGERSFSRDPQHVALLGQAFVHGLHEAGMAAVGKHFPGHGGVGADSHTALPVDERPLSAIKEHDLVPFSQLATLLNGVMPAHIVYSAFDSRPAGFSPSWLGMLRESLGFKGCIFSDDLSMAGAHEAGGPAERAKAALAAGCDMLLICNDREAALEVVQACHDVFNKRPAKLRYGRARPQLEALAALGRWRKTHARLEALVADAS